MLVKVVKVLPQSVHCLSVIVNYKNENLSEKSAVKKGLTIIIAATNFMKFWPKRPTSIKNNIGVDYFAT